MGQGLPSRIPLWIDGKFGLCDSNRRVLMAPMFSYVSNYSSSQLLRVSFKEGEDHTTHNFLKPDGSFLFKDNLIGLPTDFHDGFSVIEDGKGHSTIIDTLGIPILPFKYDRINSFEDGLAVFACQFWRWGAVNRQGEEIIPCIYDWMGAYFENGVNRVRLNGKWGLIDTKGKQLTPLHFEMLGDSRFSSLALAPNQNLIPAKKFTKWGYIDLNGKTIIPFEFDFASNFNGSIAVVGRDSLCALINTSGVLIMPFTYQYIDTWSDSLFPAIKQGKYGYITSANKVSVPFEYDLADGFSEGLALVCKNGKCGFINMQNELVIPYLFEQPNPGHTKFHNGLCWINYEGTWCYVDRRVRIHKQ